MGRSELVAMMWVCAPTTVNSSAVLSRRSRSSVPIRSKSGSAESSWASDLGVLQKLAHAHLERRVRQLARILQSLAHLELEPAVDAAIEELQGEVIHHQDRRHRERAEDRDRAALEARAGNVAAVVAHQPGELRRQQDQQSQQSRDVDEQDPRQPAVELRRILRGRGEQIERDHPQRDAEGAEHRRAVFADYGCSVHVYQSLSRCHSLTQNISTRMLKGTLP